MTFAICLEPLVIIVVKAQLKNRLAADTVKISHFQFQSLGEVRFQEISVEKKRVFKVQAQEIRVGFQLARIFNKDFESIAIEHAAGEYLKFKIEDFNLFANRKNDAGRLSVAKVSYDKGQIANIKSQVQLQGKDVAFPDLSADFLDGKILASIKVVLAEVPEYRATANFANLDIERFIADFDLRKKIDMTGMMNGSLDVAGRGAALNILGGDFKMAAPGGKLIIKDRKLLENIVERAYLDTAIETLQDYHYNAGGLQVSIEEKNLVADVNLEGRQGKRDFKIVYHP
jgi:hypothetical protein